MLNFQMRKSPGKGRAALLALILCLAAMLAGLLAGLMIKGMISMKAGQRAVFIAGLVFAAAAVPSFQRYIAEERRQALLLAGYEEKRRLYQGLLESLFETLGEVSRESQLWPLPGGELALAKFLRREKAELYTLASAKVVSAADTFLREASAMAEVCRYHRSLIPIDGRRNLYRLSRQLIKAIQEDLGEEDSRLTGDGLLRLLTPARRIGSAAPGGPAGPASAGSSALRLYK